MAVFNLIVRIIFFVCLGWSVLVLVYFFIRRGIERRKAKKEVLENESETECKSIKESETNKKDSE